jgi:hypothetical protein
VVAELCVLYAQLQGVLVAIASSEELCSALDAPPAALGRKRKRAADAGGADASAAAARVANSGTASPKREAAPVAVKGRDPAAPNPKDPWTITGSQRPRAAEAPTAAAVLRAPAAAVRPNVAHQAAAARAGAAQSGAAAPGKSRSIKNAALQEILKRAPVLPPGDYLKLWDSQQEQLDYVKGHMTHACFMPLKEYEQALHVAPAAPPCTCACCRGDSCSSLFSACILFCSMQLRRAAQHSTAEQPCGGCRGYS